MRRRQVVQKQRSQRVQHRFGGMREGVQNRGGMRDLESPV